jgi:hypothetical protein
MYELTYSFIGLLAGMTIGVMLMAMLYHYAPAIREWVRSEEDYCPTCGRGDFIPNVNGAGQTPADEFLEDGFKERRR